MKATGIIRRIDELGRIVIPKEIRKNLKITEGENIEIYIDEEDKIVLKKYSNLKNIKDFSQKLVDSIYSITKDNIIITDNNNVIASAGSLKKEIINKELTEEYINLINKRKNIINEDSVKITERIEIGKNYLINIILSNGDINGTIVLIKENSEITECEKNIINITTNFLSKYLEE